MLNLNGKVSMVILLVLINFVTIISAKPRLQYVDQLEQTIGGPGGKERQFQCASEAWITNVSAGYDKHSLTAIKVICNDNAEFTYGNFTKTYRTLDFGTDADGYRSVSAKVSDKGFINGLQVGSKYIDIGFSGEMTEFKDPSPRVCRWSGASVWSQQRIHRIKFVFCPEDQEVLELELF